MDFINEIKNYAPNNNQELQDKKVFVEYMQLFPHNILLRENEIAHITSSGFIVNKSLSKMLMIHHNIRNAWGWTGGHADGNQNLLDVAIREATEETGVGVKPLSSDIASIDILTVSGHTKKGVYVNSHLHLSVSYILIADEEDALTIKPDENSGVEWFEVERLNEDYFSARDVYLYAKHLQRAKEWIGENSSYRTSNIVRGRFHYPTGDFCYSTDKNKKVLKTIRAAHIFQS